jgi:hypothetical protein
LTFFSCIPWMFHTNLIKPTSIAAVISTSLTSFRMVKFLVQSYDANGECLVGY